MAQQAKDPALSLQRLRSLLRYRFDPWPGTPSCHRRPHKLQCWRCQRAQGASQGSSPSPTSRGQGAGRGAPGTPGKGTWGSFALGSAGPTCPSQTTPRQRWRRHVPTLRDCRQRPMGALRPGSLPQGPSSQARTTHRKTSCGGRICKARMLRTANSTKLPHSVSGEGPRSVSQALEWGGATGAQPGRQ